MKGFSVSELNSGYGYGDGYGYGYGNGYGYGDGYGDGSGDGSGSGYGYGNGYGYGDGSGSGDGALQADYLKAILESHSHKARGCVLAFWRSRSDGSPANGGVGKSRKTGDVEEIEGPLKVCTKNALHATLTPQKWKGSRWWIVALHEPVEKADDKMGSLKRTIIADLGKYPFDDN